ncbi:ABC transporter permease [Amycolatopsis magusensis]|uniref:ABC transporter permease n=1 Tax=Amycolatopsis magusensis TaxID=882444 RepID=UPI0024A84105|nr:ABC transporter permease [Amycolatopsis magusensis]MDI5982681.1 ABC transporter permease [Amycolatopsis magusensis]
MTYPLAQPEWSKLRFTVHDGLTVLYRNLLKLKHSPGQVIAGLAFPLVAVVLFGYVFGSAIPIDNGANYREYLMPGLFVMSLTMSIAGTLTVIAKDNGLGVMDRFRSMPMSRSAVPFGQTTADLLVGATGVIVMSLCGLAFGWRAHHGFWMTLAGFGVLFLMNFAVSWVGVFLGSVIKREETASRVGPLLMPVTMISNVFVPTSGMPDWLAVIAEWNPISATVGALRVLFGNPGVPTGPDVAWPLANPVLASVGWSVLMLLVFAPLSVRNFNRAGL